MATNFEINGKEYYRIKRVVGHDADGKPIYKQFYGKTQGEAKKKHRTYLEDQVRKEYEEKEALTNEQRRTLGSLMEEYATEILANDSSKAPGTRHLYTRAYENHLKDTDLMLIPICDLRTQAIQKHYNKLKISESAIKHTHKFFSCFMRWAVACNYCTNILDAVTLPEKKKNTQNDDIVVWTDKEVQMIEERLVDHRYYPAIMLSLYAGLRVSEVLGLKWSDLDFDNDIIHVQRQAAREGLKTPKYNSTRDIPMHAKIKKALLKMEPTNEFIFTSQSGKLLDYNNFRRGLVRAYNEHGIPCKKYHAYRATFATNLCRKGVRLEIASRLCGHSSVNVTAKYYRSVNKTEEADAINLI